jgi:hypothetical protein
MKFMWHTAHETYPFNRKCSANQTMYPKFAHFHASLQQVNNKELGGKEIEAKEALLQGVNLRFAENKENMRTY